MRTLGISETSVEACCNQEGANIRKAQLPLQQSTATSIIIEWRLPPKHIIFGGVTHDPTGPSTGLVMDAAGNLYGATGTGGAVSEGAIYELTPSGSGWTETNIFNFTGGRSQCQSRRDDTR
ncbi:MAG TPA: hypothetical protein VIH89_03385 [Candidatus Sulfotelmatobacter sp.]|jgi:uncharacterized repeat protein (TIGR03803 family)